MKKILRSFFYFSLSLVLTQLLLENLKYTDSTNTFLLVALSLTIFELFIKPLLKLLLLPINIITLGSIRIFVNLLGLYLAVLLVPGFSIASPAHTVIIWPGLSLAIPTMNSLLSFVASSVSVSLIYTFQNFIRKK